MTPYSSIDQQFSDFERRFRTFGVVFLLSKL